MRVEKLIIFVKAPRLGTVKTRIAQTLGDQAALEIYTSLLDIVLRNVTGLPNVELRFTPDDAVSHIQPWLQAPWTARQQGQGDLGARMHRAFEEAFAAGAERVVIIGSDCPHLTVDDIHAAWDALRTRDVVLGPAIDGGYWLIGLRQPQLGLFRAMTWSTATVLSETLIRAQKANLTVHQLRELADIDTETDWQRFQNTR